MKKTALIGSIFYALPLLALAETPNLAYFNVLLGGIATLVNNAIPILIGIALIIFFWGLVQYIRKPEGEQGRKIMIAGLVGLFVMVSVWGIIVLAQSVFNVQDNESTNVNAPRVPTQR